MISGLYRTTDGTKTAWQRARHNPDEDAILKLRLPKSSVVMSIVYYTKQSVDQLAMDLGSSSQMLRQEVNPWDQFSRRQATTAALALLDLLCDVREKHPHVGKVPQILMCTGLAFTTHAQLTSSFHVQESFAFFCHDIGGTLLKQVSCERK